MQSQTMFKQDNSVAEACWDGSYNEVRLLIEREGADVNGTSVGGNTALIFACRMHAPEMAELLLRNGAHVNVKTRYGATPLHAAIERSSDALEERKSARAIVQSLLDRGADVNVPNADGETPLHLACKQRERDIALMLMQRGANIDARNARGLKPLQLLDKDTDAPLRDALCSADPFNFAGL